MQLLQGIAVSPGVAIGEALVIDNEGFRIPRRFVARDAVEDEMRAPDRSDRPRRRRDTNQIATPSLANSAMQYGAIFDAHVQMLRDPRLRGEIEELIRERHYSPEYAVSRTLRQLRQGLPEARRSLTWPSGPATLFDHRKAAAAQSARAAPRGTVATDLARGRAGAQSHARAKRPISIRQFVLGFATEIGGAGRPHGDRRRGRRNSRRRRHRDLSARRLRRRHGDHRRRSRRS